MLGRGLVEHSEERLREICARYGADYIVLDRSVSRRGLNFPRVYPSRFDRNATFEVYRVPPPEDEE